MKLRNLLLLMYAEEMVKIDDLPTMRVDEVVNEWPGLLDKPISQVWNSKNLYKCIMIEMQ